MSTCTKKRERQKLMRTLLRRMAVEVDPEWARLTSLATELSVELQTVLRWIEAGRVTANRARQMNRRFGDELACVSTLTDGKAAQ